MCWSNWSVHSQDQTFLATRTITANGFSSELHRSTVSCSPADQRGECNQDAQCLKASRSEGVASDDDPGHVDINVRGEIARERLRIIGTATVPDGAWVAYVAYSAADPKRRTVGMALVTDGQFSATADLSNFAAGQIVIDTNFQMLIPGRAQPGVVIQRYGPRGERMTGANVVVSGAAHRVAVASTTVVKP